MKTAKPPRKPALQTGTASDSLFLPNLCGVRMVFVVVMVAELFAIVLALAPLRVTIEGYWFSLAMISMFVQWSALASCAVLCLARPWLAGLTNQQVTITSFSLILLVVTLISEIAFWSLYADDAINYSHLSFLLRNLFICTIISGLVLRYFYVQHQWRRQVKTESQARLQALQSRIRPHFLFNSMNTIASLTRSDPARAEMAVEDLAELFRVSLGDARSKYAMTDELSLCRRYLDIESLRLGNRLRVEWQVDALPDDALVPPLLIQPLLENAIYHGIESLTGGGVIRVVGRRSGRKLEIDITNPFPGKEPQQHHKGNQLAMQNIRERLDALYEGKGKLENGVHGDEYRVTIQIPYRREQDEDSDR
ncbi:MAG: sensor histidine kinase [Gammaproteobacteria bacterium]|nr:sensor histidine kinase [Gammaproteobacteria bacterium]MDH5650340.1 sensor histidine kinase [Gammaproteobacteria bacterium]